MTKKRDKVVFEMRREWQLLWGLYLLIIKSDSVKKRRYPEDCIY